MYTVVVAPSVSPGTVADDAFTHYSLLRTQEELLGLPLARSGGVRREHARGLRPRLTARV